MLTSDLFCCDYSADIAATIVLPFAINAVNALNAGIAVNVRCHFGHPCLYLYWFFHTISPVGVHTAVFSEPDMFAGMISIRICKVQVQRRDDRLLHISPTPSVRDTLLIADV